MLLAACNKWEDLGQRDCCLTEVIWPVRFSSRTRIQVYCTVLQCSYFADILCLMTCLFKDHLNLEPRCAVWTSDPAFGFRTLTLFFCTVLYIFLVQKWRVPIAYRTLGTFTKHVVQIIAFMKRQMSSKCVFFL